ncbi:MAG: sugar O-acetyltransferase [Streptococcaceae bacterium]|jgi:maltose O-acetyltransferase|nr:sugar O-acetyltransferase [Streptococcaceae bacterium]
MVNNHRILDENERARLEKIDIFQKLENGDWYCYSQEAQLQAIVKQSSRTLQAINHAAETDFDAGEEMLREFLPNFNKEAEIYFPIASIEYPQKLFVGSETFINSGLQIISAGKVTIGAHCFIGPNCQMCTPNHHVTDKMLRRQGWQYDAAITIGDDCWLGASVIILPGVSIGSNVVIGAGSVVTHDLPDNCMAAGNPARIKKHF